jgi:hypothetical protein
MLMTVLFIGRGVVWLARRLVGRNRARPAPAAPRFEYARMAAAIAVLAALPELIQWDFYRDEMAAEAHAQVTQQKLLNALTVTANKLPEFARERELLDAKGKQLRRIVPESLGVVDFVEELRAVCQQHAFRIWSWEARELTQERVHRAELTLVLEGDAANLKALSDRIDKKTLRLVAWTVDGVAGARVAARATIYAIPAWPVKAAPDSCASPRTQVWLWPWRSKLEQARRKRWELCREQERLGPVRKQVDALEVDRQRFRELIDIVEPLMSERHAARGGAPDAHRDPEPPPPPVPAVKEKRGAADKQT